MPSKNMLPKGKRRQSVKAEYRAQRTLVQEQEAARRAAEFAAKSETDAMHETEPQPETPQHPYLRTTGASGSKVAAETQEPKRYPGLKFIPEAPEIQVLEDLDVEDGVRSFTAEPAASGMRLDAYLAKALPDISRARVQLLIENGQITIDNSTAKSKLRLHGGERIEIEGEPQPAPLRAEPEDLPLHIVYEDDDLAVIDKAAGMAVHAGAGSLENNRGTLVNALLFHFGQQLSSTGGEFRPGIVHRLDKQTSGLIVVAKNDVTHRKLAEIFSTRRLRKVYIALVHGSVKGEQGTIDLPISRDLVRRIRMTTRRSGGRAAISHWRVLERIDAAYGRFTLLEVRIETGRTHQIRVHLQALAHPVVGDTLYGAPHHIAPIAGAPINATHLTLDRNFLHAAELEFTHPTSGKLLRFTAPLPPELASRLDQLRVTHD
ncbi:MAG TPA: RluA family pseudouridine synthase [Acidobacteriaceae bacterium]|jgi:23S rRNA pseudouridine1911/1915/1917 synthase|nr:RluA family pseudouridine synthase [Acidobacteriaceae bacterium]